MTWSWSSSWRRSSSTWACCSARRSHSFSLSLPLFLSVVVVGVPAALTAGDWRRCSSACRARRGVRRLAGRRPAGCRCLHFLSRCRSSMSARIARCVSIRRSVLELGGPGALGLLGVEVVLGLVDVELRRVLVEPLAGSGRCRAAGPWRAGRRSPGRCRGCGGRRSTDVLAGGGAGLQGLLGPAHRVGRPCVRPAPGGVDVGVVLLLLVGRRPLEQLADPLLGGVEVGPGPGRAWPGPAGRRWRPAAGPPPPAAPPSRRCRRPGRRRGSPAPAGPTRSRCRWRSRWPAPRPG